jgi:hypothetical protein
MTSADEIQKFSLGFKAALVNILSQLSNSLLTGFLLASLNQKTTSRREHVDKN